MGYELRSLRLYGTGDSCTAFEIETRGEEAAAERAVELGIDSDPA
jgi:hypothetical protein